MHKTSAWPLALVYAALIVYASLYPFTDWRDQGIAALAFMAAAWPKYWTGFDIAVNVAGYVPMGFLLALSLLRAGQTRSPVLWAILGTAALSLALETAQGFLPMRVPSNVDFALNALGGGLGAGLAWLLQRLGLIDRWSRFRERWFVPDARGALALLVLWPFALLFPTALPFGLGQVLERLELAAGVLLLETPFLEWLPLREIELQPLVPTLALLCVMLGLLVPCLLAFCIVRPTLQRAVMLLLLGALGVAATALSAALSYGPAHAWEWLALPVRAGLWAAGVLGLALLWVPRRACAALLLLVLALHLGVLNQASTSVYFAQTLQTWEQGRFIRFHGLAQWLGWLWPYAVLLYVVLRLAQPATKPGAGAKPNQATDSAFQQARTP